jgi:tetratricopeptide (TPR) repeat protein
MSKKIIRLLPVMAILFFTQILGAEDALSNNNYLEEGNEYVKNGKYDEAIFYYTEALKTTADVALMHYNLGVVYGKKGMWDKAIAEYETVLELLPGDADTYYNLGIAYGNAGKWNLAYKMFKKLVQLQPKDSDAHYNLALIGVILNNKEVIAAEYKILEKIAPDLALKIEDMLNKANLSIV